MLVTLNAAASPATFACSEIIDSASLSAMGKAWCTVSDRTLSINLDAQSTSLAVGDKLQLSNSQTLLVDRLQPAARFTGSVTVESCNDCVPPSAVLTGPQVWLSSDHSKNGMAVKTIASCYALCVEWK